MELYVELVALTAALDAGAVDYALCGGVALAIHGAPRATRDIDLLAREADLPRLREIALARGFALEGAPMTFAATGVSIHPFTKLARDGGALMLDVLLAEGALEPVWETRARVAFAAAGTPERALSVVSRDGLVTLKRAAGRPQDMADIQLGASEDMSADAVAARLQQMSERSVL